jgi:hypothetical protein
MKNFFYLSLILICLCSCEKDKDPYVAPDPETAHNGSDTVVYTPIKTNKGFTGVIAGKNFVDLHNSVAVSDTGYKFDFWINENELGPMPYKQVSVFIYKDSLGYQNYITKDSSKYILYIESVPNTSPSKFKTFHNKSMLVYVNINNATKIDATIWGIMRDKTTGETRKFQSCKLSYMFP